MMTLESFKAEVEAHLQRSGLTPTEFGRLAVRDPNFVFDLRNKDRAPNIKTITKVMAFISRSHGEAA